MEQPANTNRIDILDPLRGLAAWAVLWYHFAFCNGFVKTPWVRQTGKYGWLGVDMFFVISGFVIPYALHCKGFRLRYDFGRFLVKRIARIDPPYIVSILLNIVLWHLSALSPSFEGSAPHYTVGQIGAHLAYLVPFLGYIWLGNVYWTLGLEFQFYLFAAVAYPLLSHRRLPIQFAMLAVMGALAFLFNEQRWVFTYFGLFMIGVVTFQFHAGFFSRTVFLSTLAAATAITNQARLNVGSASVGAATALAIAFVPMRDNRVMRTFTWLGSISYSLYLLHLPIGTRVLNLAARAGSGLAWEIFMLTVAVAVTLLATLIFYWLVERPSQRIASWIKYSDPKKAPEAESKDARLTS